MTASEGPKGEERKVRWTGGETIDGAPVAYIIVLAAVVAVLASIPGSVAFGLNERLPVFGQAMCPLLGFILGPWAGALAAGVGRLISVVALAGGGAGLYSVPFFMAWAAAAGILVEKKGRTWLLALAVFVLTYIWYIGSALRDIDWRLALLATIVNITGLLLWLLPTRTLARDWIAKENPAKLAVGLALGCWIVNANGHTMSNAFVYNVVFRWTPADWLNIAAAVPLEQLVRMVTGTVIGVGVITGLRAIGLVKPAKAGY